MTRGGGRAAEEVIRSPARPDWALLAGGTVCGQAVIRWARIQSTHCSLCRAPERWPTDGPARVGRRLDFRPASARGVGRAQRRGGWDVVRLLVRPTRLQPRAQHLTSLSHRWP